jgi:hypothetical protein
MTTTLKAHFDGKVIVPDEAVELPAGAPLTIAVSAETEDEQRQRLREGVERFLEFAKQVKVGIGPRTWTREDLYER